MVRYGIYNYFINVLLYFIRENIVYILKCFNLFLSVDVFSYIINIFENFILKNGD